MKINHMLTTPAGSKYPVIQRTNGFAIQVDKTLIEMVEKLVSVGASKRYVAKALCCTEKELDRVISACPELEQAVSDGIAQDEYDLQGKLRQLAMDGELGALTLYLKAKHGWRDRDSASGSNGNAPSININITGLLESKVVVEQGADL